MILHLERKPGDLDRLSGLFSRARSEGIDSPAVEEVIALLSGSGAIEAARSYGVELIDRSALTIRGRYPGAESAERIAGLFETMLEGLR